MKKLFIIAGTFLGLILLTAILVPILFKDDIRAALDKELENNVDATIYYDTDAFSLSVFKNFPDLTLTIGNFGIVGHDQFSQDTLLNVETFSITVDIVSVIKGDNINIVDVSLVEPNILIKVLADGSANYDIAKETDEEAAVSDSTEASSMAIQIQSWSINNGKMIYDDATLPTRLDIVGLNHLGSGDFSQDVFDMVTTTTIASFGLDYDGTNYFKNKILNADLTMAMDLANMKFTFKENKISLNNFGFGFDGWVSMPSEAIDMDISFAGSEIDMKSILSLIPGDFESYLTGVKAGGNVNFDGFVKGTYLNETMPQVKFNFGIEDGTIAYTDFPMPIEQIQMHASFNYPSADLKETSFIMDQFHMEVDGEELTASLVFRDFEDYFWDLRVNGALDLDKIIKIVPLENTVLKGKLNAQLSTSGRMSDLDVERYEKLPTNGSLEITGFYYQSPDLVQGFGIANSTLSLTPKEISLSKFEGNAGKTDISMSGKFTNYLQFALSDEAVLKGNLAYYSAYVDVNEWMIPEDTAALPEDTVAMEMVRIPENIDFTLVAKIDLMNYDNLEIKDFAGKLFIKQGALTMEKVGFNLLDGQFEMNGIYASALSLDRPTYDFDFAIKDMSVSSAFESFNTVQKLAPVAKNMTGKFSTDFKIGGTMGEDMMPVYDDMQGAGLIAIASAAVKETKLTSAISSVSKLNQESGEVSLRDVIMSAEIKGGRLYIQPFDISMAGRKATVGGSTGMDGSLDYVMSMLVPAGQVGDVLNSAISSFSGVKNAVGSDIQLNLGILGTYDKPDVKLLGAQPAGGNTTAGVKAVLADKAKQELADQKAAVTQKMEAAKDSVTKEAAKAVEEKKEEVKEEVKDNLKNLLKKKTGGG